MDNPFSTNKSPESSATSAVFDKIDPEMLRLLAEIGFVGTACGLWNHAEDIFNGIRAVRPKSEYPVVSQALARMSMGDFSRAIQLLNDVALKLNPNNPLAQSFLGIALKQSGMANEGNRVLEYVVSENKDQQAVEIAQTGLSQKL